MCRRTKSEVALQSNESSSTTAAGSATVTTSSLQHNMKHAATTYTTSSLQHAQLAYNQSINTRICIAQNKQSMSSNALI